MDSNLNNIYVWLNDEQWWCNKVYAFRSHTKHTKSPFVHFHRQFPFRTFYTQPTRKENNRHLYAIPTQYDFLFSNVTTIRQFDYKFGIWTHDFSLSRYLINYFFYEEFHTVKFLHAMCHNSAPNRTRQMMVIHFCIFTITLLFIVNSIKRDTLKHTNTKRGWVWQCIFVWNRKRYGLRR